MVRSTSVSVTMDSGRLDSSTTYTRCRPRLELNVANFSSMRQKVVRGRTVTTGSLASRSCGVPGTCFPAAISSTDTPATPLTTAMYWYTGSSSSPKFWSGTSRMSDADRLPMSLPSASTMPTDDLWSTAMWSNAITAGVSSGTLRHAPSARPRARTEALVERPSVSRCSQSSLIISICDTTSVGRHDVEPSRSEPGSWLTTVVFPLCETCFCMGLLGSHT
eukprot:353082-Chlamydomonas_euryale.AAC.18